MERRKGQLLAAATEVLVAEPGASMSKVALAAGVSRTTLHARFPTRDDLLREVASQALEVCERAVREVISTGGEGDTGLERLVVALIPVGPQLSFLWRNPSFDHDVELGGRWSEVEREIGRVISRADDAGELPGGRPVWWDLFTLLALVYVAAESIYLGRLAPNDAPQLVLSTLKGEGGVHGTQ
jgi:AcrR family transcriptional regulator